ncbi:MAG: sodium:proton antiporter NhaD [Bacteroidia bacterium]|nr:sodium:proton antiporter NhaD [Bacteroidia bacterium]
MNSWLILLFSLGYMAIAFEHSIKLNKTASALLTGVFCWTIYALYSNEHTVVLSQLSNHLSEISGILFFLLGAMTIVELIDAHQGFSVITRLINTRSISKLFWIVSLLAFFLSAVLDNLTTAIVMVSISRKLIKNEDQRKVMAGMIIIAANAGGAWSPIGDITTTMLWIGGQITAANIIKTLFIPSLISLIVPLIIVSYKYRKQSTEAPSANEDKAYYNQHITGTNLMFFTGVGVLLFVPVFKTVTHLPPFVGVLLGLGIVWLVSELIHKDKDEEERKPYTAVHALSRIDSASILFFLGILMAVSALESTHILSEVSQWMSHTIGNENLIVGAIGLLSAVIDNVPLVAASMGMYSLASPTINPEAWQYALSHPEMIYQGHFSFNQLTYYLPDARLWEFMAYCAGTGGSVLIIGSAAGVAVMGMEKIDFMWYLKRISLLALISYFAGTLAYIFIYPFFAVY